MHPNPHWPSLPKAVSASIACRAWPCRCHKPHQERHRYAAIRSARSPIAQSGATPSPTGSCRSSRCLLRGRVACSTKARYPRSEEQMSCRSPATPTAGHARARKSVCSVPIPISRSRQKSRKRQRQARAQCHSDPPCDRRRCRQCRSRSWSSCRATKPQRG